MGRRKVVIDWDWGASGIWSAAGPDQPFMPTPAGEWGPHAAPRDRHQAWRGRLSDDLIERLQAWNDDGDAYMGRHSHVHSYEERVVFWVRGIQLAEEVQLELGDEYEVGCRVPAAFRR